MIQPRKTLDDYLDVIQEKYPLIPKDSLRKIIKYGWSSLYNHLAYGGDVYLQDRKRSSYIGVVYTDKSKQCIHYIQNIIKKMRIFYTRRRVEFDGYYYFCVNEDIGKEIQKAIEDKQQTFDLKLNIYKLKDEANLHNLRETYVFRVKVDSYKGFMHSVDQLHLDDIELLTIREPLTASDIFVSKTKYEYI